MENILNKGGYIPDAKRIVFLGDSITDDGTYIAHMNHYFSQYLQGKSLEFISLGVSSETASGLSEPDHPFPRPCVHERLDRALELSKPEWVVVCYGMNDGIYYPLSQERFNAYKEGILKLVDKIKTYGAKAIVVTPPPFDAISAKDCKLLPAGMEKYSYMEPYESYTEVLKQYGLWILTELIGRADKVIDIYTPLSEYIQESRKNNESFLYGDGIHPNIDGHWVIAKTLLKELFYICLERKPEYLAADPMVSEFGLTMERHRILSAAWKEYVGHTNPNKVEALPIPEAKAAAEKLSRKLLEAVSMQGESCKEVISDWKGYKRHDFFVNGREAILIEPENAAPGKPWIWRTEFFGAFPSADMAMLKKGWSLAYYRMSNLYGCPEAISSMQEFHNFLVKTYELSLKTVLFGFSRGGLYAFNYAVAYPDKVSVIYLDAPVLDIRSWPAGKGEGLGSPSEWKECLVIYGFDEKTINTCYKAPLDRIDILVKAGIPIIIVAGDADDLVPYKENAAKLVEGFKTLGGMLRLILKPGVGHHPHSLKEPTEIVDFIMEHSEV